MKPARPESPMDISQRCLPPARQHAGTEAALANARGATKADSRTASTEIEMPRLIGRRIVAQHMSLQLSVVNNLRQGMLVLLVCPNAAIIGACIQGGS